jgi:hypothetical protein
MLANGAGWQIVTREAVAMIDTCHLRHLADGSASFLRTRGSVTGRRRSSPGSVVAEAASSHLYADVVEPPIEVSPGWPAEPGRRRSSALRPADAVIL